MARIFYAAGEFLGLAWLHQKLSHIKVANSWHSMAREGLRDELAVQQRALSVGLLQLAQDTGAVDVDSVIGQWSRAQATPLARWRAVIADLQQWTGSDDNKDDFALYVVGIRELSELVHSQS